jgi:hypothetical protein
VLTNGIVTAGTGSEGQRACGDVPVREPAAGRASTLARPGGLTLRLRNFSPGGPEAGCRCAMVPAAPTTLTRVRRLCNGEELPYKGAARCAAARRVSRQPEEVRGQEADVGGLAER